MRNLGMYYQRKVEEECSFGLGKKTAVGLLVEEDEDLHSSQVALK